VDEAAPGVERVYPLRWERGRPVPFPTIYWLWDQRLASAIARLESAGWIATIEQQIAESPELAAAFAADHRRYAQTRWTMLNDADREAVIAAGLGENFRARGIAGIADPRRVKCLHAHVAHHLADPAGNTAARLLVDAGVLTLPEPVGHSQ
jgi:hypothetical protein